MSRPFWHGQLWKVLKRLPVATEGVGVHLCLCWGAPSCSSPGWRQAKTCRESRGMRERGGACQV